MIILDRTGHAYQLRLGDTVIGRALQCDLRLDSSQISRRHAVIHWDGQRATITDLGSTNGVLLNGKPLTPHTVYPLAVGDHLELGSPEGRLDVRLAERDSGVRPARPIGQAAPAPIQPPKAVPPFSGPAQPGAVGEALPFAHSLAVVIGIDAYSEGIAHLTTAVNDATRLADLLEQHHGYEVIRLTANVTRDRLTALFQETLPRRLGPEDRLLVYFAGHGVALDGDDGPAGHLLPQDARLGDHATYLAMNDLHRWLSSLQCRHLLTILDCCFAGAFQWAATRQLGELPEVLHKERYDRFIRSPAWQALTSAAFDQTALDVLAGDVRRGALPGGDGPHSPFAQALFDALGGAADIVPPGGGDGVITATELYVYLRDRVEPLVDEQAQHEQTPGLWPLKKHRKGEYIFLTRQPHLPPAPELSLANNPYRGLQAYDEQHRPLFFGREDEISALIQHVTESPLITVLGASGTGKSSLVKAGLLPALGGSVSPEEAARQSGPAAAGMWFVLPPMRPTATPLHALAQHLAPYLTPGQAAPDPEQWRRDPQALAAGLAAWRQAHPNRRLLLVVDQLEELITLCRADGERTQFLALLAEAVRQHADVLRLVVTLRTDFEPQFADTPLFAAHESRPGFTRYVVPPMDQADLRQVIEGPATQRVLYFDPPELVDKLINEVIQTPGALPLLSFTLSELYVKYVGSGRDDRALRLADYEALGGVIGSLRRRANEEYDRLPDDAHRATMQRVMLRMISAEGGSELTRRRVVLSELEYPTAAEDDRVRTVLGRLVEARLLVRGGADGPAGEAGGPYVEPAHDALVTAWDRLLQWKREAEEYLLLQRRTTQAALEWDRAPDKEKAGLLWNDDPRLPQLERTLAPAAQGVRRGPLARMRRTLWPDATAPRDTAWLNRRELAFVQASVLRRAAVLKRIVGITATVIVALTGLALIAFLQRGIAVAQRNEATRQSQISLARQLAAQTASSIDTELDAELSLLLAVESQTAAQAAGLISLPEADAALRQALASAPVASIRFGGPANAVAFSPDGLRLAIDASGGASLWDVSAGGMQSASPRLFKAGAGLLGFTTDGRWLITGSSVLDVHSGQIRLNNVMPKLLSPSESYLAVSGKQQVSLLATRDFRELAVLPCEGNLTALAFDQREARLALACGDNARVWNILAGVMEPGTSKHGKAIGSLALSLDGTRLATAASADKIRLVDVGNTMELASWPQATGVAEVVFNSAGTRLAARDSDKSVLLIDAHTGITLTRIFHTATVRRLLFSPDGSRLVTTGDDGHARLVDAISGREIALIHHTAAVKYAGFSPDGRILATAGRDGAVHLIDSVTGQEIRVLLNPDRVDAVAFSPDGRYLLTAAIEGGKLEDVQSATRYGGARLWETSSGRLLTIYRHSDWVTAMAFSPDGTRVATASFDNTVRLWRVPQEGTNRLYQTAAAVRAIAAQPTVPYYALAVTNTVIMLDIASGAEIRRLGHDSDIWWATFSPDGKRLVTASSDMTVRLWESANGVELNRFKHQAVTREALFNQDGSRLATRGEDRTVYLADGVTGRVVVTLTHEQPVTAIAFSADGGRLFTGSRNGALLTWRSADGRQLETSRYDGGQIAAISSDGKYAATRPSQVGGNESVSLYNRASGQQIAVVRHRLYLRAVAFSPDSARLATAGQDGTVHIIDTQSGRELSVIRHGTSDINAPVVAVVFSPDGRYLATASDDGTARLALSADGQPLATLSQGSKVRSVAFTADERALVTGGDDGAVRLWQIDVTELQRVTCNLLSRNLTEREWETYLGRNVTYRKTCSQLPVDPSLMAAGEALAREGDVAGATALFDLVQQAEPRAGFEPDQYARQIAAQFLIWKAAPLARSGAITEAVSLYQQAVEISPTLKITPETEAQRLATASKLQREGEALARAGPPLDAAIAKLEQAAELDPGLDLRPEARARELAAEGLVAKGRKLAQEGQIAEAMTAIQEAELIASTHVGLAAAWNALCWQGSLWGRAGEILSTCERAIQLAPAEPSYADSRGLARALTGDVKGAIEDFTKYVEWMKTRAPNLRQQSRRMRESWIARLSSGESPVAVFDNTTLEALKHE